MNPVLLMLLFACLFYAFYVVNSKPPETTTPEESTDDSKDNSTDDSKSKTPVTPSPPKTPVTPSPPKTPETPVTPSPPETPSPPPPPEGAIDTFGTTYGICGDNQAVLTETTANFLKDPSDANASSFDDPVYKKWVTKAINLENQKRMGANYVSVWKDGGYRSYSAGCNKIQSMDGTKTWQIKEPAQAKSVDEIRNSQTISVGSSSVKTMDPVNAYPNINPKTAGGCNKNTDDNTTVSGFIYNSQTNSCVSCMDNDSVLDMISGVAKCVRCTESSKHWDPSTHTCVNNINVIVPPEQVLNTFGTSFGSCNVPDTTAVTISPQGFLKKAGQVDVNLNDLSNTYMTYNNWVESAVNIEQSKMKGTTYVSVSDNGTYKSYTSCPSLNGDTHFKTWKLINPPYIVNNHWEGCTIDKECKYPYKCYETNIDANDYGRACLTYDDCAFATWKNGTTGNCDKVFITVNNKLPNAIRYFKDSMETRRQSTSIQINGSTSSPNNVKTSDLYKDPTAKIYFNFMVLNLDGQPCFYIPVDIDIKTPAITIELTSIVKGNGSRTGPDHGNGYLYNLTINNTGTVSTITNDWSNWKY